MLWSLRWSRRGPPRYTGGAFIVRAGRGGVRSAPAVVYRSLLGAERIAYCPLHALPNGSVAFAGSFALRVGWFCASGMLVFVWRSPVS